MNEITKPAYSEIQGNAHNLYKQFISYIDATPATIRTYSTNLKQFINYLQSNGIKQPTRETIIAYRDDLKRRCKATTVQSYIETVKLFFEWTEQAGYYPNIAKHVKGARITKEHKRDYLTSDQIKKVLCAINRTTTKGTRDYALILLMVTGGLRTIETQRANIGDIGKAGNAAAIYIQGKGREEKAAYIKLSLDVEEALKNYLDISAIDTRREQALFISLSNNNYGQRLSARSISGIIKQRLKDAGFESERLTAHSLRHSAVTISLIEGNSLQEVQQFARHKNISTTQIYAHNLDREKNNCEISIAQSIFK